MAYHADAFLAAELSRSVHWPLLDRASNLARDLWKVSDFMLAWKEKIGERNTQVIARRRVLWQSLSRREVCERL